MGGGDCVCLCVQWTLESNKIKDTLGPAISFIERLKFLTLRLNFTNYTMFIVS